MTQREEEKQRCDQAFEEAIGELEREKEEVLLQKTIISCERGEVAQEREKCEREQNTIAQEKEKIQQEVAALGVQKSEAEAAKRSLSKERMEWEADKVGHAEKEASDLAKAHKNWQKERAQWQRQRTALELKITRLTRDEDVEIQKLQKERENMMAEMEKEKEKLLGFQGEAIAKALKDQEYRIESVMRASLGSAGLFSPGIDMAELETPIRSEYSFPRGCSTPSTPTRYLCSAHADITDFDDFATSVSVESIQTTNSARRSHASSRTSAYRAGSPLSVLNAQRVPTPSRGSPIAHSSRSRRLTPKSMSWDGPPTLRPVGLGFAETSHWKDNASHGQKILDGNHRKRAQ